HVANGPGGFGVRLLVAPGDGRKAGFRASLDAGQLRIVENLDVRYSVQPVYEIARHAGREAGTAHEHVELRDVVRQKDGGLSRCVAPAAEHNVPLRAHLGFERGGPVPDAAPFELQHAVAVGPAILCSAGHDYRARAQTASVGERQSELAIAPRAAAVKRCRL